MSFFKKLLEKASGTVSVFANGDCANALISGSLLVADASGGVSDEEFEQALAMFETNPRLSGFDVAGEFGKWEKALKSSSRMVKRDFNTLAAKIKSDKAQAEEVLIAMIEVADADNDIDDAEMAMLRHAAKQLGLDLDALI